MDLQSLTLKELQAVHPNIRLAANELGLSHISDTSLTKLVAPEATVDTNGRYVLGGIQLGTVAWYDTEPVNTYGLVGAAVDMSGIQSQISALQAASTKAARIEAVQALQAALDGNATADAKLKQQVDELAASLDNVSSTQLKASVDKLLVDVAALQAAGAGGGTGGLTAEQAATAAAATATAAAATATASVEAAKVEAARLEALARNLGQVGQGGSDDYEF